MLLFCLFLIPPTSFFFTSWCKVRHGIELIRAALRRYEELWTWEVFSCEIMLASSSTQYLLVYFHTADEAFGWRRCIVVRVTVSLGFELASLTVSNVERTFCGASLCECFSCKGATSGEGMFVLRRRFRGAWVTLAYGYIQACIYTAIFGFPLWYLITLIDSESACFWIAFLKWSISYFIFFHAQAPSYTLFNSLDPTGWLQRLCLPAL